MPFWNRIRGVTLRENARVDECHRRLVRLDTSQALELREAAALSFVASSYQCKLSVHCDHRRADALSVLELLCLTARGGSTLVLEATGPDCVRALERIEDLIRNGFDVNA